jgi:uncharacterized protein involved in exopolysaccharide biosynthesis
LDREARAALQETVLQLATSYTVVERALEDIGPPQDEPGTEPRAERWPTSLDVERARALIAVQAPGGAEFGHTEVFQLTVRHPDRERAIALTGAIYERLESELKQMRSKTAQSLIDELTRSETLARNDLQAVTSELAEVERQVGGDLPELRMLTEIGAGAGHLQQTQTAIENEMRQARSEQQIGKQLEQLLVAAIDDPTHLVATPGLLLESQPALEQLKAGLITAQLQSAQLLGGMSPTHPQIQATQGAEKEIQARLNAELDIALRGVRAQMRVTSARVELLQEQLSEVQRRLVRVAGVRAHYESLLARGRRRDEILATAERDLADARSSLAAAGSSSLISRVDVPRTGNYPSGPRRAHIVAGGLVGGLLTGLGILFLTVPTHDPVRPAKSPTPPRKKHPARRKSDRPAAIAARAGVYSLSIKDALAHVTQRAASRN